MEQYWCDEAEGYCLQTSIAIQPRHPTVDIVMNLKIHSSLCPWVVSSMFTVWCWFFGLALGRCCTAHSGVLRTVHKLMTCYGAFPYCHRTNVMSCQSDHLLVRSSCNRTCQDGKCPTLKLVCFCRIRFKMWVDHYAFAKTNSCFNRNFS